MVDTPKTDWLIVKRGLYYRPGWCGYTGLRDQAGRYNLDDARRAEVFSEGDVSIVHLSSAPEYSAACYEDIILKTELAKAAELRGQIAHLVATGQAYVKSVLGLLEAAARAGLRPGAGRTAWRAALEEHGPTGVAFESALKSAPAGATARDLRQQRIASWCEAAFGAEASRSLPHRGIRFLEEAVELYQAVGGDPAKAHELVDFVFARPVGEVGQEIGGVETTVLALAAAAGLSADECGAKEVSRILAKPLDHFRKRNAEKNAAGFDMVAGAKGAGAMSESSSLAMTKAAPNPEWEAMADAAHAKITAEQGIQPFDTLAMLERWKADAEPANEHGQVSFSRAMLDSAADALRLALQISRDEHRRAERAIKSLRTLQEGAAVAMARLPDDGVVADFLAAIHREAVRGQIADDSVTSEAATARGAG